MVGRVPCDVPIINLIQGVQHGDPPRSKYLSRRAIRICMSEEIAKIIRSRANGPVYVVNPCVDVPIVQGGKRDIEVLVIGHKMKHIARKIGEAIPSAMILTEFVPRKKFVGLMRRAKVVMGLPKRKEGFYLPALEAMCSGALVVCPDSVGNRALVTDGYNCIQPIYTSGHIIDAVKRTRALPSPIRRRLLAGGLETAKRNRPTREYRQFMAILRKVDKLWQTA
jgi:glycosyltransferase involved in cell wall biosynthesis